LLDCAAWNRPTLTHPRAAGAHDLQRPARSPWRQPAGRFFLDILQQRFNLRDAELQLDTAIGGG